MVVLIVLHVYFSSFVFNPCYSYMKECYNATCVTLSTGRFGMGAELQMNITQTKVRPITSRCVDIIQGLGPAVAH